MEELDDHLLQLILLRAPVEDVARAKCVNNRFKSLISDPFFIGKYHYSTPACGLLHVTMMEGNNFIRYIPFSESENHGDNHSDVGGLAAEKCTVSDILSLKFPERGWKTLDSCSGFILFQNKSGYYVCNPRTKKHHYVPEPPMIDRFGNVIHSVGLALESSTFLYKVVLVYSKRFSSSDVYKFMVFSQGKGCWQASKETISCNHGKFFSSSNSVYFRGVLHWLRSHEILAFHIKDERAWTIMLPTHAQHTDQDNYYSDSCFTTPGDFPRLANVSRGQITIWMLKDYDSSSSSSMDHCWQVMERINIETVIQNCTIYDTDYINPVYVDGERVVLIANHSELKAHVYNLRLRKLEKTHEWPWLDRCRKFIPQVDSPNDIPTLDRMGINDKRTAEPDKKPRR